MGSNLFVSAIHLDIFYILDQVLRGPRWGATLRLAFPSDSFAATRLLQTLRPCFREERRWGRGGVILRSGSWN